MHIYTYIHIYIYLSALGKTATRGASLHESLAANYIKKSTKKESKILGM